MPAAPAFCGVMPAQVDPDLLTKRDLAAQATVPQSSQAEVLARIRRVLHDRRG